MKRLSILVLGLVLLTSVFSVSTVEAASPNISRSYESTSIIPNGSLVSLVSRESNHVDEANVANGSRLTGVVVVSNQSLLAVNPSSSSVQVATDGVANVLVSNINGNISVGQQVAVSPFNGVGMKADTGDRIIGTAATSFKASTAGATLEKVTDASGNTHSISVGYVRLVIGIATMGSSGFSIQSLQEFLEGLIGHPISIIRIAVSLIVAFVAIFAIVILIYASIYGSIVSIGRNPLAKLAIYRTLTSVIGMVVVVATVASLTIYFLLY